MRKSLLLIVGIAIMILGVATCFYVLRNVKQPITSVQQQGSPTVSEVKEIAVNNPAAVKLQGEFKDGDAVHNGSGQAKVVETADGPILKFENFRVTAGPDLFVYLSPNVTGQDLGEFISLDRLKNNSGEQVYNLPDNYADYKTVVIWCRAFGVTFATAELR